MRGFPSNDIIALVEAPPKFDLAESVGPDLRLGELIEADSTLASMTLGYGTAQGDPSLRKILADLHGVGAEDVVVTVGGAHALFLLAFLLCERGDEAVTTSPVFPVTRNSLEAVGATVRVLQSTFDRGYRLDLGELQSLLSPRTKLVSLASPQNPSGVAIPRSALKDIIEMMRLTSPEAFLLVDETYREASYGDDPIATTAVALDERVIATGSLSKCHGAPGLRIGWAITRHAQLRRQLTLAKFNTVISCSPLDEALAVRVLERREEILAARRKHLALGLARTEAWVQRNADFVEWVRPDAGALCCVRLKADRFGPREIDRFVEALTKSATRIGRGTWFGEQPNVLRLGFGLLAADDLQTALDRTELALRQAQSVSRTA